ncbi:hypothetical protein A9Q78_02800 [Methylophaga sp. 41_12_T18]|nr:hypothetical protein A9Q78_02800 [Methylophaga sp. 41_12_T18]
MQQVHHQRHWLALLTAILLLMQSFAIWHDAEHAFHIAEEQCERFEAYGHSPTLDIVTSPQQFTTAPISVVVSSSNTSSLPIQQRDAHSIRAPPIFS